VTQPVVVALRVTCTDDSDVPKVVETLSRACAGLALEGLFAALFVHREEEGDEPCR
jgi:hypothetical protein